MTTQGLTSKDWKRFKDLLIKANDEQVLRIDEELSSEKERRLKKFFGVKE